MKSVPLGKKSRMRPLVFSFTLRAQDIGGVPVSGELLPVVVSDGVNVVAQRVQPMHRGAVRGVGCWTGQFRNGREQAFALDMGQQGAVALRPDDGVALPVAESRLGCDNRGALRDVDAMRDHAASGMLGTTQVVALAPSTQEPPEITAHALVPPDHLIDPFRAEREAVFVPQPKAELLWTPPFRPQLPSKSATNTTSQFAWLVPDLLRSGLC